MSGASDAVVSPNQDSCSALSAEQLQQEYEKHNRTFALLVDKKLPADYLHEDELCIAVRHPSLEVCQQLLSRSINGRPVQPEAPTHVLIVAKRRIPTLLAAQPSDASLLGHLMLVAAEVAKKEKLEAGFRIVLNEGLNTNARTQWVHLQLLGGRQFTWPPG